MNDDRFTICHHADGTWEIADREFASLPHKVSWQMGKMALEEAERVVSLMNELDRRLSAKHGIRDFASSDKATR